VTAVVLLIACATLAAADDKNDSKKKKKGSSDPQTTEQLLAIARASSPTANAVGPRWIDNLLGDARAYAVNDLLTVNVVESVNASGSADASVTKAGKGSASIGNLFGWQPKNPTLLDTTSATDFKGGGTTTRSGTLTTNVTVRVAEVMPNGNLVLEGAREVQINGDRQVFLLTGVVRPIDISPNNVVLSTAIAQLHVQYVGNGLLRDSLSPGWLIRIFNKVF
jgi:flagellar L-ring protein precursor FlgH